MLVLKDSGIELKSIIIDENCKGSSKAAAEELALFVKKITDIELPIFSDTQVQDPAGCILIGETKFNESLSLNHICIEKEGYAIRTGDDFLVIWGDDEEGDPWSSQVRAGTLFGVMWFLDNVCDIAWLWPGETGEVYTRTPKIIVPKLDLVHAPAVHIRSFLPTYRSLQQPEYNREWQKWARRNRLGWITRAYFAHSWGTHLPPDKYRDEHPEYYSLVSPENWVGPNKPSEPRRTSLPGDYWQTCTSNPDVRRIIIESVLNNDKYEIVSISPNDGYQFCECESCQSQDLHDQVGSDRYLSERMWDYANFIARKVHERDPEKGVGMFAYTFYFNPPKTIDKFEPNLYISHTMMCAYVCQDKAWDWFTELVDEWQSHNATMIAREYWGTWYFLDLPFAQTPEIKKIMPYLYKKGYVGFYGETGKNFSNQLPDYYLLPRLMWDPNADSDAILEEFYRRAYGQGAEYMKRYWELLHDGWSQNLPKKSKYGPEDSTCDFRILANSLDLFFGDEVIEKCEECLNNARKSTDDKGVHLRLDAAKIGLDYTRVLRDLFSVYRKLVAHGIELAFFNPYPSETDFSLERRRYLLEEAYRLGEIRRKTLEEYHSTPYLNKGLYEYACKKTERNWHGRVIEELNKTLM